MGRPFTARQSLGTTRYQTSMSWTEEILKCQFMQIIRFFLEYLWRCQNVISFFIFFLLFLYIHSFSFLSSFNSLPLIHTNTAGSCMVHSILLVAIPSGQPPGQVQPFGPRGGGSCPGGRGLEQIKNIFSLILRSMCHFSRGLHDGYGPQDYVFLRKNAGICRRVVGEE